MKNTIFITMFMAILGCAKNESNDPNPWQRIGFQGTPVTGLVIDANFFVAGTSQGVFVSHDLALSWIEQNSGLDDLSIESVAKDSGGILFVSTGSGIYRSLDSGKTWIASYLHAGSAGWSYMTVSPANVLFATYERRDTALLRSTNQGLSWQPLIWQKDGLRRMTFEGDSIIYLSNYQGYCLKSTNLGQSWINIDVWQSESMTILDNVIYAASIPDGLSESEDHGQTWVSSNCPIDSKGLLVFKANSSLIVLDTEGQIVMSSETGWDDLSKGWPGTSWSNEIVVGPNNTLYAATSFGLYALLLDSNKMATPHVTRRQIHTRPAWARS